MLAEFYPAFIFEGYVYAPATSVALNRSFQTIFRAPLELAHLPEKWEIFRYGSVWHDQLNEDTHELGIWGQTFWEDDLVSGGPAPGVTIEVLDSASTQVATTTSDTDGFFEDSLSPGMWTVCDAARKSEAEGCIEVDTSATPLRRCDREEQTHPVDEILWFCREP